MTTTILPSLNVRFDPNPSLPSNGIRLLCLGRRSHGPFKAPPGPDVFHHLHFCLGGAMVWLGPRTRLTLRPGEAALGPRLCPIGRTVAKAYHHDYAVFSGPVVDGKDLLEHHGEPIHLGTFDRKLLDLAWTRGPLSPTGRLALESLVSTLILPHAAEVPVDETKPALEKMFPEIMAACARGMRADDRIETFARAMGLSPNTLSVRFRRAHGSPLKRFLENRLSERACALLLTDDRDLAAIGESLGFRDVYAFCHFFARKNGLPPGRWRRRHERGG